MLRFMRCLFLSLVLVTAPAAWAVITVGGSTSDWSAIVYSNGVESDYIQDQQTGQPEADIIGSGADYTRQPGFYKQYLDAGLSGNGGLEGDYLGFRMRVSGDTNSAGWDTVGFIGLDFEADGSTDLILGVGTRSRDMGIRFYDPGTDLNTSPSTTSVIYMSDYAIEGGTDAYTNAFSVLFDFSPVSSANDAFLTGGESSDDLDADGNDDYFMSFQINMEAVAAAAAATANPTSIDENTMMGFLAITSNQDNALNQDLNGHNGVAVNKGGEGDFSSSTQTWSDLGGMSDAYTADGSEPVPEPKSFSMILGVFTLCFIGFRRRIYLEAR